MSTDLLPPVAPEVLAEAVENLTARLRKKLDAAIEACASEAVAGPDGSVSVRFGEDAVVTLRPGPSGVVTAADEAVCGCLLAPRCLHRAAVLGAAPLADPEQLAAAEPTADAAVPDPARAGAPPESGVVVGAGPQAPAVHGTTTPGAGAGAPPPTAPEPPTAAQLRASAALWEAAAAALAAGVAAGGAVVQAELLRAAH
ncbi:hypothetical protein ABT144_38285, partial [Streptomyces sp. NPDC002039]